MHQQDTVDGDGDHDADDGNIAHFYCMNAAVSRLRQNQLAHHLQSILNTACLQKQTNVHAPTVAIQLALAGQRLWCQ